jgi:transposase-like protein
MYKRACKLNELAKDLKTPEDLSVLTAQLTKITVEAALNAELDHRLGYTQ